MIDTESGETAPLKPTTGQKARESVMVDFKPLKGSKTGEQTARFEIVLGLTPEDTSSDRGKLVRPTRRSS